MLAFSRLLTPSTLLSLAGAFILLAGATGCSSVYTVKVDAIRTPEVAPRRTYHLVATEGASDTDPLMIEAKRLVDRALEMNGLFAASRPEWADMVIELDLGIGQRRLISVPDTSARDSGAVAIFVPNREGGSITESTGTYLPTAALTRVIAVWEKRLSLLACENSPTPRNPVHSGAELWRVDVAIQDPTPSIEGLLPILTAALLDSIDRDTGTRTFKRISESSSEVFLVSQAY